ncbi:MAG: DUF3368 domain-containing protein [Isosphaeraceae bacterium]
MPEAVLRELEAHGRDDDAVKELRRHEWIRVIPTPEDPPSIAAWDLGPGESAVLALAHAESDSWAVIDDGQARRCARSIGVPFIGTLGLVFLAKQCGRITLARPILERLKASGMYLSDTILEQVLRRVGE